MIVKGYLPKSLFGRVLLILVLPMVFIQLVMAFIFYDRHWDNISRHMSNSLAGDMAFFVYRLKKLPPGEAEDLVSDFVLSTGIAVTFDPHASFLPQHGDSEFPEFKQRLKALTPEPLSVRKTNDGSTIEVRIQMEDTVLRMETTVKRLESPTTVIFLLWMTGASSVFLLIAVLFLRNQIRPIRRLAEAAESFGRGMDIPDFRPHGATEVRKAARAFIIMRERIRRQLRTRTEMLAGISHDLRTPLTRMKLELAMLPDDGSIRDSIRELGDDVQQMEHMIQEYLAFARGEGREEAIRVSLRELLEDVVNDYLRLNAAVTLADGDDVLMDIRVTGFRRMLHNVIDNALRYGRHCEVRLHLAANHCEVMVDDDGPGIPVSKRDEVFKPFNRLDPSRNIKTGGVGLGLTIARDIALAHGGSIRLESSPQGGLRVVIRLPL
jgi:two-component system, OmpR family, osmolarity sensor histidine kinase EnvZ